MDRAPASEPSSTAAHVYSSRFTPAFETYLNALEEEQQALHFLIGTSGKDITGRVQFTQDMRSAQHNILALNQALNLGLRQASPVAPPRLTQVRDYQLVNRMRLCQAQYRQDVAQCISTEYQGSNLPESFHASQALESLPPENSDEDTVLNHLESVFRSKNGIFQSYEPTLPDLLNMVQTTIDAYESGFDSTEAAKQRPINLLSLCTGEGRYEAHLLHAFKMRGYRVQSVISVDHAHNLVSPVFDQAIEENQLVETRNSRSFKHFDDAQEYLEMRTKAAFDLVVSSNFQVADFNTDKNATPEISKYHSLMNTVYDRNPNVRVINIDFSSLEGRTRGGVFQLKR